MSHILRAMWRAFQRRRFAYTPLVEIHVSREAILHNLHTFQKLGPVAPVLKSNAYGHGLVEIARIVAKEDVPFICVDSYFEALILRNEGIRTPILILGYTTIENMLESMLEDVSFGIVGMHELRALAQQSKAVGIHLKIDTGMHRHGIAHDEIDEALHLIRASSVSLRGVYSHFADAETKDSAHAQMQVETWNTIVPLFKKYFPDIHYHLAATSGSFFSREIDANVMRLGIGLYGFNASLGTLSLKPALQMKTRLTSVRKLKAGESIGYNATYKAPREMRVATLPAGYYEGIDRRLSNKGSVIVEGTRCPIVGRVSMNITSVDVSAVAEARVGMPATVISNDAHAPNSVENIARECATIPYEILVHIPAHLRRTVD